MPTVRVLQINAFCAEPHGGNPAGVVPCADGLSGGEMQALAHALGWPETVFLLAPRSPDAALWLRYFTPVCELPLCGHATVAALWACASGAAAHPLPLDARVETGAGLLEASVVGGPRGARAYLDQPPALFRRWEGERAALATALRLAPEDLEPRWPLELVSTGLWDLMVGLRSLEVLEAVAPDLDALARLAAACEAVSVHLFVPAARRRGCALHARNFAPGCGIPEDPATGTSNGALACYLARHGHPGARTGSRLTIEQGLELGRPGEVHVELCDGLQGLFPRVGGDAALAWEGEVDLP